MFAQADSTAAPNSGDSLRLACFNSSYRDRNTLPIEFVELPRVLYQSPIAPFPNRFQDGANNLDGIRHPRHPAGQNTAYVT